MIDIRKNYTCHIINMNSKTCESTGFKYTNEKIGCGAYGEVKVVIDKKGDKYAMKIIKIDKINGIQNIIECYIMNTITHPNIMKSKTIIVADDSLCIIQDIAISDMYKYTRKNMNNYRPKLDEMITWMRDICNGIYILHRIGIIHGDIKANNILLFADNNLKISDFSLSQLKKINTVDKKICTITHRPLECFAKNYWDEKVDIWALGCTIYEIYYGFLLFPVQNDHDVLSKQQYFTKCINCMLDWGIFTSQNVNHNMISDIPYKSFIINDDFNKTESFPINDVIKKCLILNEVERPSIMQIMNSNKGLSKYKTRNTIDHTISQKLLTHEEIIMFHPYNLDKNLLHTALKTYKIIFPLKLSQIEKIEGCIYTSNKIHENSTPISFQLSPKKLNEIEIIICRRIRFIFDIFDEIKFRS